MTNPNDIEEFPPPSNPMAVARQLMPTWTVHDHAVLRYWRASWMRWQGTHWAEAEEQDIRATVYRRLEHGVYLEPTATGMQKTKPWSPSKRKIADLLEALTAITFLRATTDAPTWIDGNQDEDDGPIVACANGLLRVADLKLLDHDPRFFNLVSVPFDYDPGAQRPSRWLEFLNQVWADDPESIAALQEFFGYVLSGRTDLHKMLLMVGPPRSGKGTIARILTALVGQGNMAGPTLASLATNFGLAPLIGKPLAIISDARLDGRNSTQVVERLLTISGEDTIDVDRKYREPWTGRLPTRFMICSNVLPKFDDASGAIASRFIVLTMKSSWLGQENTNLTEELLAELPGVLNWALDGLDRLTEQGRFTVPPSSEEAVNAMKDAANPLSPFLREFCEVGPGHTVPCKLLFQAWENWCQRNGITAYATNIQTFGQDLRDVVPQIAVKQVRTPDGRRERLYSGIRFKQECRACGNRLDDTALRAGWLTHPTCASDDDWPTNPS
ncbi:DNA primase family protein [Nonomuraea candida]|uniref:DNA primase family protein n=1 Tax=Nonomuraea candida TaxID=359159 RepID=UPI0007C7521F|nr:phage/plasmid primase, P4 family [Nonomuraea candida]